jgi:Zn-dependent protease/CBS domain-containing protein
VYQFAQAAGLHGRTFIDRHRLGAVERHGITIRPAQRREWRWRLSQGTVEGGRNLMRQTLRLGRIAGIPVGVHWSVLVIMALLVEGLANNVLPATAPGWPTPAYWATGVAAALLFLGSLLAHEMAHALVALHYRIPVKRVTLWLLGGVAELEDDAPHPRADLFVAAAGPVTSLLAGALFGAAASGTIALDAPVVVTAALGWLAVINVILAVFNLLPGAPLDGGRVLRAVLWRLRGDRVKAGLVAARIGYGLGALLVAGGFAQVIVLQRFSGLWLSVVGWFLMSAARAEQAYTTHRSRLAGTTTRAVMNAYPITGHPDQTVEDFHRRIAGHPVHRAFPLRDWDGRPAGVVRLADLAGVPGNVPLGRLTLPPEQVAVVEATRPATDLGPLLRQVGMVLVVENGLLVGMVTTADLARTGTPAAPRP